MPRALSTVRDPSLATLPLWLPPRGCFAPLPLQHPALHPMPCTTHAVESRRLPPSVPPSQLRDAQGWGVGGEAGSLGCLWPWKVGPRWLWGAGNRDERARELGGEGPGTGRGEPGAWALRSGIGARNRDRGAAPGGGAGAACGAPRPPHGGPALARPATGNRSVEQRPPPATRQRESPGPRRGPGGAGRGPVRRVVPVRRLGGHRPGPPPGGARCRPAPSASGGRGEPGGGRPAGRAMLPAALRRWLRRPKVRAGGVAPRPPPPRRGCPGAPPAPGAGGRRGPAGRSGRRRWCPAPGLGVRRGRGRRRAGPGSSEPVPAPPAPEARRSTPPPPAPSIPAAPRGSGGDAGRRAALRAARPPPGAPHTPFTWCLQPCTDPCPRYRDVAELVHPALPLGKLRHGWVGTAALPGRARPGTAWLPACPGTARLDRSCCGGPTYLPEWVFMVLGLPHRDRLQGSKPQQPPPCLAAGTGDLGSPWSSTWSCGVLSPSPLCSPCSAPTPACSPSSSLLTRG